MQTSAVILKIWGCITVLTAHALVHAPSHACFMCWCERHHDARMTSQTESDLLHVFLTQILGKLHPGRPIVNDLHRVHDQALAALRAHA